MYSLLCCPALQGFEYWERERRLCACMLRNPTVLRSGQQPGFTLEDVHATSMGKSFDYRVGGWVGANTCCL